MGLVFGTRTGHGGMLGKDNYPLSWMAIQATKNEKKKYTPLL
jgi:hypothetical protein